MADPKNKDIKDPGALFDAARTAGAKPSNKLPLTEGPVQDTMLGKVIDKKYRLIEKLGAGNFGTVYLTEHIGLKKNFAIKILNAKFVSDEERDETKLRFQREAQTLADLNHKHIVLVSDTGSTEDERLYIVMEYLHGKSLWSVLNPEDGKERIDMDLDRALKIVSQICSGLAAAHAKKIIHRDIKTKNVMLVENEGDPDFVKIIDFGIAKINKEDKDIPIPELTQDGSTVGTPFYMSPEQIEGRKVDQRTDIYAVGIILYEIVTGLIPHSKCTTTMQLYLERCSKDILPPSAIRPDRNFPPELDMVVMKALARNREERYTTVEEFAAALAKLREGKKEPEKKPNSEKETAPIGKPKPKPDDQKDKQDEEGKADPAVAATLMAPPSVTEQLRNLKKQQEEAKKEDDKADDKKEGPKDNKNPPAAGSGSHKIKVKIDDKTVVNEKIVGKPTLKVPKPGIELDEREPAFVIGGIETVAPIELTEKVRKKNSESIFKNVNQALALGAILTGDILLMHPSVWGTLKGFAAQIPYVGQYLSNIDIPATANMLGQTISSSALVSISAGLTAFLTTMIVLSGREKKKGENK